MNKPKAAMWAGIAFSAVLLVVLLERGWGERAWNVAVGVLLVLCLIVCVVAAITGERATRTVGREVARLAEQRRRAQH